MNRRDCLGRLASLVLVPLVPGLPVPETEPATPEVAPFPLPFPVEYRALGPDAGPDLLDQGVGSLLTGFGVPVEMFRGGHDIQVGSCACALRIHEQYEREFMAALRKSYEEWIDECIRSFGLSRRLYEGSVRDNTREATGVSG